MIPTVIKEANTILIYTNIVLCVCTDIIFLRMYAHTHRKERTQHGARYLMLCLQYLHIITSNTHSVIFKCVSLSCAFAFNMDLPCCNGSLPAGHRAHMTGGEEGWNGMGVGKDQDPMHLQRVLKFLNPISFSIGNLHLRWFYHGIKSTHRDIWGKKQSYILF